MDEKDDKEGATYLKQVRYQALGFSKGWECTTKFNLCTEIGWGRECLFVCMRKNAHKRKKAEEEKQSLLDV